MRLLRVLGIGLLALMASVGSNGLFAQSNEPFEPPPPINPSALFEAYNAGLLQDLNVIQTRDTVSVRLGWAYTDPRNIHIGITGLGIERIVSATLRVPGQPDTLIETSYQHPDAHWLEWRIPPDPVDWQNNERPSRESLQTDLNRRLALFPAEGELPETITVELAVTVRPRQPATPPNPEITPEVAPGATPALPDDLTLTFDLTLNLLPFQVIEPDLSVTSNDVTYTVERVAVSPILTVVDLCYSVAHTDEVWYINSPDLYYGENRLDRIEQMGQSERYADPAYYTDNCARLLQNVLFDGQTEILTLTLAGLFSQIDAAPEALERLIALAQARGITAEPVLDLQGRVVNVLLDDPEAFEPLAIELGLLRVIRDRLLIAVPLTEDSR